MVIPSQEESGDVDEVSHEGLEVVEHQPTFEVAQEDFVQVSLIQNIFLGCL